MASLCHDIGKAVSVLNHPRIAAEILRPYVSREVTVHMILAHQDFQGRHYYEYFGQDPDVRDRYAGRALVRAGRAVRRRVGPEQLRPRLPHQAALALRADGAAIFGNPHVLLMAPDPAVTAGSPSPTPRPAAERRAPAVRRWTRRGPTSTPATPTSASPVVA